MSVGVLGGVSGGPSGVAEIVTVSGAEAALTLPAASVAVTVSVCVPPGSASVRRSKLPSVPAVTAGSVVSAMPSTCSEILLYGSAVPVASTTEEKVSPLPIWPVTGLSTGAAGACVSTSSTM